MPAVPHADIGGGGAAAADVTAGAGPGCTIANAGAAKTEAFMKEVSPLTEAGAKVLTLDLTTPSAASACSLAPIIL